MDSYQDWKNYYWNPFHNLQKRKTNKQTNKEKEKEKENKPMLGLT